MRAKVTAAAIAAGLAIAYLACAGQGTPAPIVWRDHVVETSPTAAP